MEQYVHGCLSDLLNMEMKQIILLFVNLRKKKISGSKAMETVLKNFNRTKNHFLDNPYLIEISIVPIHA